MTRAREGGNWTIAASTDAASTDPTIARFTVRVNADIERAFRVFTEEMSTWWPREHHINAAPMAAAIFEPRVGGRWYELGTDGSECDWGVVLAWDPPHHLAVTWHLDGAFTYDPAGERASRVDVRFRMEPDGTTRVDLEHSGLDRHGPSWRKLRDAIASPGGWPLHLGRFLLAASG